MGIISPGLNPHYAQIVDQVRAFEASLVWFVPSPE